MSLSPRIQVVGLSHRTAPVEVREAVAFHCKRVPEALAALRQAEEIRECVILSTCNRVELYLCARDLCGPDFVRDFLASFHGIGPQSLMPHLYHHEDIAAVSHLFRVAAGLDSMVLGEAQVTSQVREAYELAAQERAVGRMLHRLFQQALAVAKQVRSCSEVSAGRASVGSVAVQLAEHIFESLSGRVVLLVGAGKMGEIVFRSLRAAGAQTRLVANRTFARAEALAQEFGGEAVRFDRLEESLGRADIVISSTGAPHHVIARADIEKALRARRGRPIFLIDIAVPRDIDPAVAELDGCYLYNLDDLQAVVHDTMARRNQELDGCLAVVDEESREFMHWLHRLDIGPTIAELRGLLHALKDQELNALQNKLPDLPEASRREIERMADRLVNKILHQPISALHEPVSREHSQGAVAAARRLFGLDAKVSRARPASQESYDGERL